MKLGICRCSNRCRSNNRCRCYNWCSLIVSMLLSIISCLRLDRCVNNCRCIRCLVVSLLRCILVSIWDYRCLFSFRCCNRCRCNISCRSNNRSYISNCFRNYISYRGLGKISGSNFEPLSIRNIIDCLKNTIGINIAVSSLNNAIRSPEFLF